MRVSRLFSYQRRRRRVPLVIEDHLRYMPPSWAELDLFEAAERALEKNLVADDPDAIGFVDFFERHWRKYGPPVRRGLLCVYAVRGDEELSEMSFAGIRVRVRSALEQVSEIRQLDRLTEAFLLWSASSRRPQLHVLVARDEWAETVSRTTDSRAAR